MDVKWARRCVSSINEASGRSWQGSWLRVQGIAIRVTATSTTTSSSSNEKQTPSPSSKSWKTESEIRSQALSKMVVGQHGNASVPTACSRAVSVTFLHQIQLVILGSLSLV